MSRSRTAVLAAVTGLCALLPLTIPPAAFAHGSTQDPSWIYYCRFSDSPENPQNAACRAAIALGGTQPRGVLLLL